MILADTSVWIEHMRKADTGLRYLLESGEVLVHAFVIGELAMGNVRNRAALLSDIAKLPHTLTAREPEVRRLIEQHKLFGRGIGYIDAHLLAAVRLTGDARLWTRDQRLHQIAVELRIAMSRNDQ